MSLFRLAASPRHVHHLVAHVEEHFSRQGFGKEIRHIVLGGHEGHTQFTVFDTFADEAVSPLYMLSLRVMLWVV